MAQITINNPTTQVVHPTQVNNGPITVEGNGEKGVQLPTIKNDGNIATQLNWSITNIQNGTYVSTALNTGSVSYSTATSGSVTIQPNANLDITFFLNVPKGQPGVAMPACTAEYTAQWSQA